MSVVLAHIGCFVRFGFSACLGGWFMALGLVVLLDLSSVVHGASVDCLGCLRWFGLFYVVLIWFC